MRARLVSKSQTVVPASTNSWSILFAVLLGALLGLGLIKFGNPAIFDDLVSQPPDALASLDPGFSANPAVLDPGQATNSLSETIYRPWSMLRGLWMSSIIVIVGVKAGRWKGTSNHWILWLPVIWLGWQCLSAIDTVNVNLTRLTLLHFLGCVACFFAAWYALSQKNLVVFFWAGLVAGFSLVLWNGLNQHYGGLEALRKYIYEQPDWKRFSPDFLKRVGSGRVYASLFYPNALAGAILMLLPPVSVAFWRMSGRLPRIGRGVLVGLLVYLGIACLIWSGSKAGWLIALVLGLVALFQLRIRPLIKWLVLAAILVFGLAGFFVRYAGYFQRGATSVGARFDYWRAAVVTAKAHPVFGTGPGTFGVPYKQIKDPKSEMARLVHNDYLEQASDSGIPGFLLYSGFILASLIKLYRSRFIRTDPLRFSVWLGLLGFALQGSVEFGLYIPALAWTAFALFGWLWGGVLGDIPETVVTHKTVPH
jgi:hypothetical protein